MVFGKPAKLLGKLRPGKDSSAVAAPRGTTSGGVPTPEMTESSPTSSVREPDRSNSKTPPQSERSGRRSSHASHGSQDTVDTTPSTTNTSPLASAAVPPEIPTPPPPSISTTESDAPPAETSRPNDHNDDDVVTALYHPIAAHAPSGLPFYSYPSHPRHLSESLSWPTTVGSTPEQAHALQQQQQQYHHRRTLSDPDVAAVDDPKLYQQQLEHWQHQQYLYMAAYQQQQWQLQQQQWIWQQQQQAAAAAQTLSQPPGSSNTTPETSPVGTVEYHPYPMTHHAPPPQNRPDPHLAIPQPSLPHYYPGSPLLNVALDPPSTGTPKTRPAAGVASRPSGGTNVGGGGGGGGSHGMPPLPPVPGRPPIANLAPRHARPRGNHRKALSSSAAMPGGQYGAFWNAPPPVLAPPPPPVAVAVRSPTSPQDAKSFDPTFSPRSDFMALVGDSPRSETGRKNSRQSSPRSHSRDRSDSPSFHYSMHPPPMSFHPPPLYDHRLSPRLSEQSPLLRGQEEHHAGGGEAAFHAHRRVKALTERGVSTRKHGRQQSIQNVMTAFKGVEQPRACRDVMYLLLFGFHLLFMLYLGSIYGRYALAKSHEAELAAATTISDDSNPFSSFKAIPDDTFVIYYDNLVKVTSLSGVFASLFSGLLLMVMMMFSRHFVQVMLLLTITMSFIWGTLGVGLSPRKVVPISGIVLLALAVGYTFIVWDRIPFAAANLETALSAIRAYPGTLLVAFIFQALALGWTVYCSVVAVGIYDAFQNGMLPWSVHGQMATYALLGYSYYWTIQVLLHAVQASTAGVVLGWWHHPEGGGSKEPLVKRSAFRVTFYSMGSICFGSLFIGPVRLLRVVTMMLRPNSDGGSLMCLYECFHFIQTCIASCVDYIKARFNIWAFTYIGLYGYDFIGAAMHATEVFEKRGWQTIASDDLVPNILLMTSLVIGGVTGCIAYLMARVDVLHLTSLHEPGIAAFYIGTAVGLVVTSVLFGLISSAVNAVLVCFAAYPLDFEKNHPELSSDMRRAWREVWPGALEVVEMNMAYEAAAVARSTPQMPVRVHRRALSSSDAFNLVAAQHVPYPAFSDTATAAPHPSHRRTFSGTLSHTNNVV